MQYFSNAARLLLLRHAHSGYAKPGQKDIDRNLDERGIAECAKVAAKAGALGYLPTRAVISPAQRCAETAALFLGAVSANPEVTYDHKLYDEDGDYYLQLAGGTRPAETLLVVGHNPMTEHAFESLAGDSQKAAEWLSRGYPTAGLAVFVRSDQFGWQLEDVLSP